MEMPDPSSVTPQSAEEQTLNQAAPQSVDAAVSETVETETDTTVIDATPAPEQEPDQQLAVEATEHDPEAHAEDVMTAAVEEEQEAQAVATPITQETLLQQATALLQEDGANIPREQITHLRQRYASLRRAAVEEARTQWAEQGGDPEAFVEPADETEAAFNEIINQLREKKNAWAAEQEEQRQANLKAKNEIIDQILALADDTDNVNRTFPVYRELQDKFNAIGAVPPVDETSVWKRFQDARERYSDNLKINKELRDYDFKKNLESKHQLISEAVALDAEADVIAAFRRLQDLHDKWRQVGPVAKELREEIWTKFKDASASINKKYQAFFEERKAREAENEAAKTALCEQIETIDLSKLASFQDWETATKQIIDLQGQWKALGFASKKANNQLFARFRQKCDEFFAAKADYFKGVKDEYAANLAKKTALAERAEALKDSTEWRKTADEFVALQKEWKTIGPVPKRHSDAVWKRFLAACDAFFDAKKAAQSGQRATEQANLKAKKEVIEGLQALVAADLPEDAADQLHKLQDKWQETGHVPFKDKDKINEAYRVALNEARRKVNQADGRVRMERFEANISEIEGDQGKLLRERDRLVRAVETRRNELRTYENNLGFLTSKSKSGQSMVEEFRHKIDKIKEDIASIEDKIRLIDSKLQ